MSHPSPSSTFQVLFDTALQDYEKQTGTKLADHPLAKLLESCDTVDSITDFLQERTRAFSEFRGEDGKVMRSLKRIVHVLYNLSASTVLGEGIGIVCRNVPFKLAILSHLRLLNSRSHPRKQYSPVSLSYSPYVPLFLYFSVV
jgi:hypothetical protein